MSIVPVGNTCHCMALYTLTILHSPRSRTQHWASRAVNCSCVEAAFRLGTPWTNVFMGPPVCSALCRLCDERYWRNFWVAERDQGKNLCGIIFCSMQAVVSLEWYCHRLINGMTREIGAHAQMIWIFHQNSSLKDILDDWLVWGCRHVAIVYICGVTDEWLNTEWIDNISLAFHRVYVVAMHDRSVGGTDDLEEERKAEPVRWYAAIPLHISTSTSASFSWEVHDKTDYLPWTNMAYLLAVVARLLQPSKQNRRPMM